MTHWPGLSHFPPLIMIVIIKIVIIKIVIIIIIFIKRHNKIKRHKKIKRHLLNFKQKGLVKASIKARPTLHLKTLLYKIPHHFQISTFSDILTIYPHLQKDLWTKTPIIFRALIISLLLSRQSHLCNLHCSFFTPEHSC